MPVDAARACPEVPLAQGDVWVGPIVCNAQRFANGDGGASDLWLANGRYRAAVRSPLSALTLAGLGGGTLIDGAPWGRADALQEVAPLVDGGWLEVDDLTVIDDDALVVSGTVRALPDRPLASEGARRTVTWRVAADDPWLHLEDADGLWIHADGAFELLDGWLVGSPFVIGHDGVVEEDLGGALRLQDVTRLLLSDRQLAWAERPGPHARVAGRVGGANQLDLLRGSTVVGRVDVAQDGTFDVVVPADVDAIVPRGVGRRDGQPFTPGEAIDLDLGPEGAVDVRLSWPTSVPRRPVEATWRATDGREGTVRLPPDGGVLRTGPGEVALTFSTGPWTLPRTISVQVDDDTTLALGVALEAGIVPAGHALAATAWLGGRSRTVRDDTPDRMRQAVQEGFDQVIVTAEDDVEDGLVYLDDAPWLRWEDATTVTHPDGWSIQAWPFRATARRSGHGAPRVDRLDPVAALREVWGGEATDRTTRVDLAWLEALEVPVFDVDPVPDQVALVAPGPEPFAAWTPWFRLLDAGRFVRPTGPAVWLDVGPRSLAGPVEYHRAWNYGQMIATTAPHVSLRIRGAGPGDVLQPPEPPAGEDTASPSPAPERVVVEILGAGTDIDRVSLITEGAVVLRTWTFAPGTSARLTVDTDALGLWTTAVAWSTNGEHWAVASPVWSRAPTDSSPRARSGRANVAP